MRSILSFLVVFCFVLSACQETLECEAGPDLSGLDQQQLQEDIAAIEAHLDSLDVEYESHPSGLRYRVIEEGTGRKPTFCNFVTVNYSLKLIGGDETIDSGQGYQSRLTSLILGWQVGVPLMKPYSEFIFYVPSGLGYGPSGSSDRIPPNALLEFRIRLNNFQ